MASEARLNLLKKMIILQPQTAILGPQFCRILVLGPQILWSGWPGPPGPPGSAPVLVCHIPEDIPDEATKVDLAGKAFYQIRRDDFTRLMHCIHLILAYNWISEIEDGSFRELKNLKILNPQKNYLRTVTYGMLPGLHSLEKLSLVANEINHLIQVLERIYQDHWYYAYPLTLWSVPRISAGWRRRWR